MSGIICFFSMNEKLILASSSPRRKQIFELAEIPFEVISKDTDESFPKEMHLTEVPIFVAKKKALAIALDFPGRTVVAADTLVVLENEIIGKPKDKDDARSILAKLSGKIHEVITGVAWIQNESWQYLSEITKVEFEILSTEDINFYVDKYRPMDKAGAYAVQEWIGVRGIKSINGCFYNVMGFPASKFINTFKHSKH